MALLWSPIIIEGKSRGGTYIFQEIGDELPAHSHPPDDNHYTLLPFGAVECFGRPEIEGLILEANNDPTQGVTVVDWAPDKLHGFRAKIAGTKMVQLKK